MSTRAGPGNNSSNNSKSNSNNNNPMSAKRAGGSRRISESALGSATTTSTSTSSVNQSQQHVADKSAVKRKKRRKDEETEAPVVERVPIVLLTRLEDEKKLHERKTKQISDIKVVVERTNDIESIKASSSDKLVLAGKKSTRHSVHRSSENVVSSDAKTLEPLNKEKQVLVEDIMESRIKRAVNSCKNADQTEESIKAPSKSTVSSKHCDQVEESAKAPSKKADVNTQTADQTEESVEAPQKKASVNIQTADQTKESLKASQKKSAKSNKNSDETKQSVKAPRRKSDKKSKHLDQTEESVKVSSNKSNANSKNGDQTEESAPSKSIAASKQIDQVEDSVKAPSKKSSVIGQNIEQIEESTPSKPIVHCKDSEQREESVKAPRQKSASKQIVQTEESVKVPSRKTSVTSKNDNQTEDTEKVSPLDSIVTSKNATQTSGSKAPAQKSSVSSESSDHTVDNAKASSKKSVTSRGDSDVTEESSKIKNNEKSVDSLAECNVHNVNIDNLKNINPKRQLLVRLDRSVVKNYLKETCLQRLHSKDKLVVETNENHSENQTQESDALSKASKEIKTCAIPSDAGVADQIEIQNNFVEQSSVDVVTDIVENLEQKVVEVAVQIKGKKKVGRPRKNKNVEKTAKSVVNNQRPSLREKRMVKSQDIADECNKDDRDKDLEDDTKINADSSVQMNENQIEHLDESSKDTSCESAKSTEVVRGRSLSQDSAVVNSEIDSSKKSKTSRVNNKVIESKSIASRSSDNTTTEAEPVPLPMEVHVMPHDDHTVDDSKAESDSAQQICDIHSKNVTENAKSAIDGAETVEKSTKEIVSESAQSLAESFVDSQSSASLIENLISSDDSACPAKSSDDKETPELPSTNVLVSENLVNSDDIGSPADSFASCQNELTNEGSISENNESLIENLEDTESTASTCTLIEETPEELSQNLDKELETDEELPDDADKQPEIQDEHNEIESVKELPQVAEKQVESPDDDGNAISENFTQEDKSAESNEQESTFENNLKSVENLVIDSILNGEIVSPKIIAQSASSKVEEVQSFVFESAVEDFVNDIVASKETSTSLESSTSTEETPVVESLEAKPVVEEESLVAETLEPSVSVEESVQLQHVELSVPVEKPVVEETLPAVEQSTVDETSIPPTVINETTTEKTLESSRVTEQVTTKAVPTDVSKPNEEKAEEEFAKHRRKHTLLELKKKCTENIDKRQAQALDKESNSVVQQEPPKIVIENQTVNSKTQGVIPAFISPECILQQTMVTNDSYFENISDAESDICLSDRLGQLTNLKIPSFEDEEKSVQFDEDDDSSLDHTKRQRILMKITKTEANNHVTQLVESKVVTDEAPNNEQLPVAEPATEGEIKIIMRKESTSNNHMIKEIKIIPRTPEGGNSARIPGYSPTSSDLSSGNSSCRVPSCSPAKPDSGSYRMPGWSPASMEVGQTTIKKKMGRPKKYPIFTDAELIAKTTAIVNNVDVHANKITDKPLFQPVESIRINEDNEVENNDQQQHRTAVTEQLCLSGNQLLDAMPAKPEVLAKLAQKIEEGQGIQKKKKKMGRQRKYPLIDSVNNDPTMAATVTENVIVAKAEFSVVDSIEELVDTAKPSELLTTQISPTKKKPRGRPRRVQLPDNSALLEESVRLVEDITATIDEAVVERTARKAAKHLNNQSQLSKSQMSEKAQVSHDILEAEQSKYQRRTSDVSALAEETNSMTEDESIDENSEALLTVERRGRKSRRHSKDHATEGENSMTENEDIQEAIFTKPKVGKRGRKPWKHLKNLVSSQEPLAADEKQPNERVNDDSILSENQVTETENSMTESEDVSDASSIKPKVGKKRGRKPWKHLKNVITLPVGETPTAEEGQSVKLSNDNSTSYENVGTESEDFSDTSQIRVKKRGRKPWKHLKNVIPLPVDETPVTEDKNDDEALYDHAGTETENSMTESEDVSDASLSIPKVKRRGRKPWKNLMNKLSLDGEKKKRGRPRKSTFEDSVNELFADEFFNRPSRIIQDEPVVSNLEQPSERVEENDATQSKSVIEKELTENQTVNDTTEDENVTNCQSLELAQDSSKSLSADEPVQETTTTVENEITNETSAVEVIVKKKRGRPFKNRPVDRLLVTEKVNSDDDLPISDRIPKKPEDEQIQLSNDNQVAENEAPVTENQVAKSVNPDEAVEAEPTVKKRGRKPYKHLLNKTVQLEVEAPVILKKKRGRPARKLVEAINSITDESANELSAVESSPDKTERLQRRLSEVNSENDENIIAEKINPTTEGKAVNENPTDDPIVKKTTVTEDETVSSTEDIPTVDRVVQKKRVRFSIDLTSVNSMEESSSWTEDETVSSTEDIPKFEQTVVRKGKPGRPRKMCQISGLPSAMKPPVLEKRRGRPKRILLLPDSPFLHNNSTTQLDTTEDETVSSTEDIPTLERSNLQKDKVAILPMAFTTDEEMSESLAASSIEELSTLELPVKKKRGRKPRSYYENLEAEYNSSMGASSVEDLSSIVSSPIISPKKRGRKPKIKLPDGSLAASSMEDLLYLAPPQFMPKKRGRPAKALSPIKISLTNKSIVEERAPDLSSDSIEEFSPVKQLSPVKLIKTHASTSENDNVTPKVLEKVAATLYESTFENEQPVYERSESLSPIKRRGRPPKNPRKESDESQSDSLSSSDQTLEKRRGRVPRRLSQDENYLPSIISQDVVQSNEKSHEAVVSEFLHSETEDTRAIPSLGKRQGRPPRKFSPDEDKTESKRPGRPRKYSSHDDVSRLISDSDETIVVRKKPGRKPKKLLTDDGGSSSSDASLIKRKGRPPKIPHDDSLPVYHPATIPQSTNNSLTDKSEEDDEPISPIVPKSAIPECIDAQDILQKARMPPTKTSTDGVTTISTTNLLRQQRKPKMAQPPQVVAMAVSTPIVTPVVTTEVKRSHEPLPPFSSIKKRPPRYPKELSIFDLAALEQKKREISLPNNMTTEQLRQRRHSQDDSMFSEDLPKLWKQRSKEFEDAQPKKKRGRQPKIREPFVIKSQTVNERISEAINSSDSSATKETSKSRIGRPGKTLPEKTVEEKTSGLTAADFLRTWTDRDDSPGTQTIKKTNQQQRRFSQDDSALSRLSSRNRLRRYSQGDTLENSSYNDLMSTRKRMRSSGSADSVMQDEKRPRVEKKLCTQHSITKELVVQLTKIDKTEETPSTGVPMAMPTEPLREIVKMNLRRKLESNNNAGPPPLVPIEPRVQPPTHSDAKLLMLMQPPSVSDDKAILQPGQTHMQPPPQQFCIIFIPDALTSSDPSLNKDSQPTATIVNFQPVPDAELANKSVIYTPTTPTKIFVNEEQHNRVFLCTTCTQALDLMGRLEANVGMTEEDKCAIKCPFCSNDFQSLFYLEYHLRQEHLKCENEKQCRHSGFNTLRIPSHDASSESEIYITFALKCRSCYELFENVMTLNEHVKAKHANLIRHKPPLSPFASTGMVCYPPPPFKNGTRAEVLHCPSDCICRIGIRSTDSPQQRAQVLKRCPNFMRRLEKIEAAAYVVYTCTLCKSTFLMKDEVVEHLMKMHEVSCKFPCTKCLTSFRAVHTQENHPCSETTIRDLDKLINIVIMPNDKAHDNSKFEDSSNDELGPMKTTPPPAIPSASTPLNGIKRKNGVVIQRLSKFLSMQPPKKPKLDPTTGKKKIKKTPCPKCQKKFAYRKSLNDHIVFEHIIPCKTDEAFKNMAVELLRLVNNGGSDAARIEELTTALGKYTDDDGVSLTKLTMISDEQENWNEAKRDLHNDKDLLQCSKCTVNFKLPANSANLPRRNNHQKSPENSPAPQLCERCDPTRRSRNVVNNGHNFNAKPTTNGMQDIPQQQHQMQLQPPQVRYTYECERCGDTFPTTIEMNRHNDEEHRNKPSDAHKCEVCSKIFYSPRMLEKHKKMQHEEPANNSLHENNMENMECNNQSAADVSKDSEVSDTINSSTSRRESTDNTKEEEKCKCPHCDFSAEKVSLKNHLKREHGVMAFICQFCGKLLVEISEVRHMLDYHIKSNRKNGNIGTEKSHDDVSDLLRTLGKKRLQSLMIYHDFEGKCNNAIMRCPICPEQFATRESCRHHYQWMHDSTCILCDANFSGGNVAGQHKVAVHNSIASYVWAIQRLVSAIVQSLRLDRAHPSHVLYQEVSMRLDVLLEQESNVVVEGVELPATRINNSKPGTEETVPEPFLEPVVLSEDQLPGSGNMIEVVIGNDMVVEDSEDNLLENFYLSPNYESSCEQPKILDAGSLIPELEEEEEVVTTAITTSTATVTATTAAAAATAAVAIPAHVAATTTAVPTTSGLTTSSGGILIPTTPVTAETYATSSVFRLRQDNGQEEVVLAITDEDLLTYRDDINSLAEKLYATCDSLSRQEITDMLVGYFENVGTPQTTEGVELANAIEPRTQ